MEYNLPPKEVLNYFNDLFKEELDALYYGNLYVLPLTEEGEEFYNYLINEEEICRYGCYTYLKYFNGEPYNIILVNND